jgi:hypothetical protein
MSFVQMARWASEVVVCLLCTWGIAGCGPASTSVEPVPPVEVASSKGEPFELVMQPIGTKKVNEKIPLVCGIIKQSKEPLLVETTRLLYPKTDGYTVEQRIEPRNPPIEGYWTGGGHSPATSYGMRFFTLMDGGYNELSFTGVCGPFALPGKANGTITVELTYCEFGKTEFKKCILKRDFDVDIVGEGAHPLPPREP